MDLRDFRPRPMLVTRESAIARPRFPVIDAHNHLAEPFARAWDQRPVSELIAVLDEPGVVGFVDLDGGWGEAVLERHLDHFKAAAPERFKVYGGVDWAAWPAHGDRFGEWAAGRLRAQAARGAEGLKIWKPFGLTVRDQHGALVAVDDPRLDPLWAAAGELRLPVLIHVADPAAYRLYYRFLETDDEHFNYDLHDPPRQGRWRIYGLHLPGDVLAQVYYQNAQRVMGWSLP